MLLAGLDGCRSGWIAALNNHGEVRVELVSSVADLVSRETVPDVIAIDIPIGLSDDGPRECDQTARKLLGERRSSVFPAPIRGVLEASNYEDACRISESRSGKKISKQAWAIVPKIREVDDLLQSRPDLRDVVVEVHPELIFATWDSAPMKHAKSKFLGLLARLTLRPCVLSGDISFVSSGHCSSRIVTTRSVERNS